MSFPNGVRLSDSIASKIIEGGFPSDLDGLRFNAALNIWEFVPFGGGGAVLWTVLGDYEAAIAEGSHNFNFAAVDFDNDSKLVLVISGSVSAAGVSILLRINTDVTANYFGDGFLITAGVEVILDRNALTTMDLSNTTLHSGVNEEFNINADIFLAKSGTFNRPTVGSMSASTRGLQEMAGRLLVVTASITDITVLTSSSTWQIGTRMTLYKVARA